MKNRGLKTNTEALSAFVIYIGLLTIPGMRYSGEHAHCHEGTQTESRVDTARRNRMSTAAIGGTLQDGII
jgi:hypothetical protein